MAVTFDLPPLYPGQYDFHIAIMPFSTRYIDHVSPAGTLEVLHDDYLQHVLSLLSRDGQHPRRQRVGDRSQPATVEDVSDRPSGASRYEGHVRHPPAQLGGGNTGDRDLCGDAQATRPPRQRRVPTPWRGTVAANVPREAPVEKQPSSHFDGRDVEVKILDAARPVREEDVDAPT